MSETQLLINQAKNSIKDVEFLLKLRNGKRQEIQNAMADEHWEQMWIREWWLELDDLERAKHNKEISSLIWKIKMLQGKVKPNPKRITDEDIYQAKQIPITSLYTGTLRKSGGRFSGRCPFHSERSGSFVIYPANNFHCFGCQANGTSIDYVILSQKVDFLSAVKYLIRQ